FLVLLPLLFPSVQHPLQRTFPVRVLGHVFDPGFQLTQAVARAERSHQGRAAAKEQRCEDDDEDLPGLRFAARHFSPFFSGVPGGRAPTTSSILISPFATCSHSSFEVSCSIWKWRSSSWARVAWRIASNCLNNASICPQVVS